MNEHNSFAAVKTTVIRNEREKKRREEESNIPEERKPFLFHTINPDHIFMGEASSSNHQLVKRHRLSLH